MVKNAGVAHHRAPPPGLSARLGANLGEEGLCAVGEGIMATPLDPHVMVVVEHVALARRPKQREHGMGRHHSGQQMHAQLLLLRMAYIIRRLLLLRHTVGRRRDVSFPNQLALACLRVIEGLIRGARHLPDGPRIHFLTHPQVRTEQRLADAADALLQRANRTDCGMRWQGAAGISGCGQGIRQWGIALLPFLVDGVHRLLLYVLTGASLLCCGVYIPIPAERNCTSIHNHKRHVLQLDAAK
mmetsp:Transcript_16891/g.42829  ORF Transcript_16891/g.42829 Transcript_16891/m.42829 type:complete len:242 (-) Transcript_16891:606-1331(-)